MKVLLINGSPHKDGCTYTALSEVAKALDNNGIDTEFVHIGTDAVHGCAACFSCAETGACVFGDDACNVIIEKMRSCDGVVVGSPVYYAGPAGALCAVLERAFCANLDVFKGKPAAAVVCCRRSGSSAAFDRLNKFFAYNHMPIVTSQNCWNVVHGNTPEEAMQDREGIQTMRVLGKNMSWLLHTIDQTGVKRPEPEDYEETNFI